MAELQKIKIKFGEPNSDLDSLRTSLQGMEEAFTSHGNRDLSSWTPELLDAIDICFTTAYVEANGDPSPYLFFPDSVPNLNQFASYCTSVDLALRRHANVAPKYAREYFTYYTIWQMRDFRFPVPLGTKSTVSALDKIARSMRKGFAEVSRRGPLGGLSPKSRLHSVDDRRSPSGHILGGHFGGLVDSDKVQGVHRARSIRGHASGHREGSVHQSRQRGTQEKGASSIDSRRIEAHAPCGHGPVGRPLQIFLFFFANLTTRIADVEIQMNSSSFSRDIMNKFDFAKLKEFYEATHKSIIMRRDKSSARGKGKTIKEDELDTLYEKALSGNLVTDITDDMPPIEKKIRSLGWDPIRFAYEWRSNHGLMKFSNYDQQHRSSIRRGERLLVMSGLRWNTGSHAQGRDWTNVIAAITLETLLVESYRFDILKSCAGVCALRDDLRKFFLSMATHYHRLHPVTGKAVLMLEWDFPDGIKSDIGPNERKVYEADKQRKELSAVNPMAEIQARSKRNGVKFVVETLQKNQFLWCSDPKAPHGTMETLAHQCINTLAQVSSRSMICSAHIGSTFLPVDYTLQHGAGGLRKNQRRRNAGSVGQHRHALL